MSSKYAYRTEDTFTQNILERCLEHYQNTMLFSLTGVENRVINKELEKLRKLGLKRLEVVFDA